ncbi:MFS transporter [Salicibibacter cibarius]|uniref:MFS transporter n=1 Tax=Salicibibacter cibarius TaxID=2743000 RepID=A0A7T6Z4V0_9BACI|nr:MFS transporter [Salicibibacter cibarius]QQK76406.1 MFS transporter [Salicibibacter cibarius]
MSGSPAAKQNMGKPFEMNERTILVFWGIGMFLMTMNTTMFNVALPTVITEFQIPSSVATWIVSGYSVVFALSAITFSRLSDYVPIRRLISFGLLVLGISSLIGFFSNSFLFLLLARLFQAIGASALPSLAVVLFSKYIPVNRRGNAMAVVAASASLGFGMGPLFGGVLTEQWGWNYLFLVPFAVLVILPIIRRNLPSEAIQKVKFDVFGAILIGVSVGGVLLFVTSGIYIALIFSIPAMFLLWKHIHKAEIPFIQSELLHYRSYLLLLLMPFTSFFMNFATLFTIPILLSELFNKNPLETGLIIFPGAILAAFSANLAGKVIDRKGPVNVIRAGLAFLFIAYILFAFFANVSPYASLGIIIIAISGSNILLASANNEVSRILPATFIGSGMGLIQLSQFVGGAFGAGVAGMLISVQQQLPQEEIFRNLFFVYIGWMIIAHIVFHLYLRSKKAGRNIAHDNSLSS